MFTTQLQTHHTHFCQSAIAKGVGYTQLHADCALCSLCVASCGASAGIRVADLTRFTAELPLYSTKSCIQLHVGYDVAESQFKQWPRRRTT